MTWVIVGIIAALVVIVVGTVLVRRRSADGMESFQRHIDALSPEARRRVVDHVQDLDVDDDLDDLDDPDDLDDRSRGGTGGP